MYEYNLDLSFGTGDSSLQLPSAYYKRRGQDKGLSIYGKEKKLLDGLDGLAPAA